MLYFKRLFNFDDSLFEYNNKLRCRYSKTEWCNYVAEINCSATSYSYFGAVPAIFEYNTQYKMLQTDNVGLKQVQQGSPKLGLAQHG